MRFLLLALFSCSVGCGSHEEERHAGTATIVGTVAGLQLASNTGVSISRMYPPTLEVKVSPGGVACEATQAGDRITFDLGAQEPGIYSVVTGYPSKAKLSAAQARAHVCAAKPESGDQPPCHDVVRSGRVTVTKVDPAEGGRVEGSYEVVLADGAVSGTFSAYRCN